MRLSGTVYSNVLEMDTDITIITPNDLKDEPYQVVYLLHGLCGNNKTWLDYTMLPFYAEHGRSIYVLPEVGRSFYADMQYGQRYFTYIADELPTIVRNVFRVSADRRSHGDSGRIDGWLWCAQMCAVPSRPVRTVRRVFLVLSAAARRFGRRTRARHGRLGRADAARFCRHLWG